MTKSTNESTNAAFEKFWEPIATYYHSTSSYKTLAKTAFEAGQASVWKYINDDITEKNKSTEKYRAGGPPW